MSTQFNFGPAKQQIPPFTGATSSANGDSGLVPAPTTTDVDKFLAGDGTFKSGGKPMVILSYGNSTWAEFESAYNSNVIVYCRASSNSNPATGSQTRMAFMAYVNNAITPTEVEFQYYRSVSSHTASQQGDQVFVYKLTKTGGWTVTTREASVKVVAGSNITGTYSSGTMTISGNYSAFTGATSSAAGTSGLVPAPSAGDEGKYLKGDGTWGIVSGGSGAAFIEYDVDILTTDWVAGTNGYSYTYTNSNIVSDTLVDIFYIAGAESVLRHGAAITKAVGSVTLTVKEVPTGTLSIIVRLIQNTDATIIGHASTTAEGIVQLSDSTNDSSTSKAATANAVKTVKDSVDTVNTNLGSPSSASGVTGADAFSKINTLNSNIATVSSTFNTIVDPKQNSKKLVTRITKNYTNVSIGADGYANIDTTTTILSGVPYASSYALIGMMIQSFSNGNIYSLARGSTMENIYVIGKPNSTVTFGVQYFFMNTTIDTQSY